jgi:putative tricarboxylic transport membrane protein
MPKGTNGTHTVRQPLDDTEPMVELETPTYRGDVIAAALCSAAGIIGYYILVPAAVYVPPQFLGTVNSPAFLPYMLFLVLTVLSAIYLVKSVVVWRRSEPQGRAPLSDWGFAIGTAGICIGYIAAIYIVGMTTASGLCVAAMVYYYGERRFSVIGSIALIMPILLWVFFVKVAHILFPTPLIPIFEIFLTSAPLLDSWQSAAAGPWAWR